MAVDFWKSMQPKITKRKYCSNRFLRKFIFIFQILINRKTVFYVETKKIIDENLWLPIFLFFDTSLFLGVLPLFFRFSFPPLRFCLRNYALIHSFNLFALLLSLAIKMQIFVWSFLSQQFAKLLFLFFPCKNSFERKKNNLLYIY